MTVEVTGEDGSPASDIGVAWSEVPGVPSKSATRKTDADGRIVLRHVGLTFALSRIEAMEFRIDLPLLEPLTQRVPRGVAPADPVRFRLPAGGSLEVELEDLDGRPEKGPFSAAYELVRPGEPRQLPRYHPERPQVSREARKGRVLFPFVAVGAEIQLVVRRFGLPDMREVLPGPRFAGEHLVHTVVVGGAVPLLELRAVDAGGAALAETHLDLTLGITHTTDAGTARRNAETDVETDAEGRFHLERAQDHFEGDQLLLRVDAHEGALTGQIDLSRPFPPGRVRVGDVVLRPVPVLVSGRAKLVLRGTGGLAGRLVVDPDVPLERLELRAAAIDLKAPQEGALEWSDVVNPRADGEFTLEDLLPGPNTVVLSVHRGEVVAYSTVLVEAGTLRRDPSLDPLDLRGRLWCRRLTLVPSGPVERLAGSLEYWGDGSSPHESRGFDGSPIEVVTSLSSFDGTLRAEGFRDLSLRGVDGDRELRLERAPEVRLSLPSRVPLPDPPRFLVVKLLAGEGRDPPFQRPMAFDERREVVWFPPATGTFQVLWFLERKVDNGTRWVALDLPAQTIEVEDRPGQRFELRVDPDALRMAIEVAER